MSLLTYLLHGKDACALPRDWWANTERLQQYEAWTKGEAHGQVVKTAAQCQAENTRIVAEREQRVKAMAPSKVIRSTRFGGQR